MPTNITVLKATIIGFLSLSAIGVAVTVHAQFDVITACLTRKGKLKKAEFGPNPLKECNKKQTLVMLPIAAKTDDLMDDVTSLRAKDQELMDRDLVLIEDVSGLQVKNQQLTSKNTQLMATDTALTNDVTQLRTKDADLMAKDMALMNDVAALQTKDTELMNDFTGLQQIAAELQAKDMELMDKDTQLIAADTDLMSEVTRLRAKDADLIAKDAILTDDIGGLKGKAAQLMNDLASLGSNNQQLMKKDEVHDGEIVANLQAIAELQQKAEELDERVFELEGAPTVNLVDANGRTVGRIVDSEINGTVVTVFFKLAERVFRLRANRAGFQETSLNYESSDCTGKAFFSGTVADVIPLGVWGVDGVFYLPENEAPRSIIRRSVLVRNFETNTLECRYYPLTLAMLPLMRILGVDLDAAFTPPFAARGMVPDISEVAGQ